MSHVSREWVMLQLGHDSSDLTLRATHTHIHAYNSYKWNVSLANKSRLTWMSHISHRCVMSQSRHDSWVTNESRMSHEWVDREERTLQGRNVSVKCVVYYRCCAPLCRNQGMTHQTRLFLARTNGSWVHEPTMSNDESCLKWKQDITHQTRLFFATRTNDGLWQNAHTQTESCLKWDMTHPRETRLIRLAIKSRHIRLYFSHTATHCNTLQHTATHCNTLTTHQTRLFTHCNTMQHTATHCNTLQHTHDISDSTFLATRTYTHTLYENKSSRMSHVSRGCVCRN